MGRRRSLRRTWWWGWKMPKSFTSSSISVTRSWFSRNPTLVTDVDSSGGGISGGKVFFVSVYFFQDQWRVCGAVHGEGGDKVCPTFLLWGRDRASQAQVGSGRWVSFSSLFEQICRITFHVTKVPQCIHFWLGAFLNHVTGLVLSSQPHESRWDLAYLKFCCKVQGIRNELFANDVCKVSIVEITGYIWDLRDLWIMSWSPWLPKKSESLILSLTPFIVDDSVALRTPDIYLPIVTFHINHSISAAPSIKSPCQSI